MAWLAEFGLNIGLLSPGKCQLYVTKTVEDGDQVMVAGVVVTTATYSIEIMGIKMLGHQNVMNCCPPCLACQGQVLGAQAHLSLQVRHES